MRRVLACLLLIGACDDGGVIDTAPDDDGCPAGFERGRNGGLLMSQFVLDGLGLVTDFQPNATYGGLPATCISEDGETLALTFTTAGEAFGTIFVGGDIGSFAANAEEITFRVQIFGDDEPFTISDWQQGLVDVTDTGSGVQVNAQASGFSDDEDHNLGIQFTAEATR